MKCREIIYVPVHTKFRHCSYWSNSRRRKAHRINNAFSIYICYILPNSWIFHIQICTFEKNHTFISQENQRNWTKSRTITCKVLVSCTIYIFFFKSATPNWKTVTGYVVCNWFWIRNISEFVRFLICMKHFLPDVHKDHYLNYYLIV